MSLEDLLEKSAEEQIKSMDLGEVSKIAQAQLAAQAELLKLLDITKIAAARLYTIETKLLPEAMAEVHLSSFTLDGGATVSLKDTFACTIVADEKDKAISFLEKEGQANLVKCVVTVSFDATDYDMAKELTDELEAQGYHPSFARSVHGGTLKSWFKRSEDYHDIMPKTLFHTFIGQKAIIK